MTVDDKLFKDVPLNTRERSRCSPRDPGPNWRGILLNAPKQVSFRRGQSGDGGSFLSVPVCGLYTLALADLINGAPMKIHATDTKTRQIYTGTVVDNDPSPEEPPPFPTTIDPATLTQLATSSYFNVNVTSYVALPAGSAVYDIVIEYGGRRSDKVTIAVVETP